MVMKQTQTKLFDFSDVGLDFSAGSKALFPDRFKKMLALGYNPQTASSASITGNQLTLTYGVTHGYVADRVLQVTAAGGYNKEVYIDSVTSSTVTFTDATATGLTGLISTKVAPLGWELVYELAEVQLYKMKYLDERDLYIRLIYSTGNNKSVINICAGKTANIVAGTITDTNSYEPTRSNTVAISGFGFITWYQALNAYNNYTYSQGFPVSGKACLIGSKYHLCLMLSAWNASGGRVYGVFPFSNIGYDVLDYPMIVGQYFTSAISTTTTSEQTQLNTSSVGSAFYVGNVAASAAQNNTANEAIDSASIGLSSFLPNAIDGFNTTTAAPIPLYERDTKQFIGIVSGGLYRAALKASNVNYTMASAPNITSDIENSNLVVVNYPFSNQNNNFMHAFAAPIEEIKIVS